MKISLLFLVLFLGTHSFASEQLSAHTAQSDMVSTLIHFNDGKGKKARKGKRANKRRKRKCNAAARRNFAG